MKKIYAVLLIFIAASDLIAKVQINYSPANNMAFVSNEGQIITSDNTPANMVHFKASVPGMEFYVTDNGLSYVFVKHNRDAYDPALGGSPTPGFQTTTEYGRIDMQLKNASINKAAAQTLEETEFGFNYYYAHCPNGLNNLKGYYKLVYPNVYPNIDWVIHSDNKSHLKYEFIVHPGGDPSDIKMEFKYADLNVAATSLTLSSPMGQVSEQGLYAYIQETNAQVAANYVQVGNIVSVNTQTTAGTTLVIDPPLYWSTYWGSAGGEQPQALVCSTVGEYVFVAGYTNSTTFPTFNPGGGTYYQGTIGGSNDAFLVKFDTNGVLFWSTFYGGSADEGSTSYTGISVACGSGTDVWLVGTTNSANLPLQNMGGSAYYQATNAGAFDFFVIKFNYAGVRQHATYVGGSSDDGGLSHGNGADCDPSGNLYFSGKMVSANFPLVNPGGGAYFDNTQNGSDDLCIVKLTSGGQMVWSTIFGGSGDDMNYSMDLHVDRINSKLYLGTCTNSADIPTLNPGGLFYYDGTINGGSDMYLARFSFAGVMTWGTYIGGSSDEWLSMSVNTAPDGDVAMITLTGSTNMPCVNPGGSAFFDNSFNGTWDIYLCRLESTGQMSWSTYYGTANNEHCQHNLTVDANGNVIMCGVSDGGAAPPTFNPGGGSYYNGVKDAMGTYCLVQFNPAGVMLWGTFWGGSGHDHLFGTVGACIGVSFHSDIFVCGETTSTDLPMLNPGLGAYFDNTANGGQDGFVAKFNNDIINNLPIELVNFSCAPTKKGMAIEWTTMNELSNHKFTVERTLDGENYNVVGEIAGAISNFGVHNYSYTDEKPYPGVNYCRLTQTDFSGKSKTYDMIACNNSVITGPCVMSVYTVTGQLMGTYKTADPQSTLKELSLQQGVYLIQLKGDKEESNFKHVVNQ